jgi:hypothetical protein
MALIFGFYFRATTSIVGWSHGWYDQCVQVSDFFVYIQISEYQFAPHQDVKDSFTTCLVGDFCEMKFDLSEYVPFVGTGIS